MVNILQLRTTISREAIIFAKWHRPYIHLLKSIRLSLQIIRISNATSKILWSHCLRPGKEDVHSRGQITAAPLIQLGPGLISSAFLPNGVPHIFSESDSFSFFFVSFCNNELLHKNHCPR